MRRSFSSDEELVPFKKRVVLAFSCTRGSCRTRARFERAFLGLLHLLASKNHQIYHVRQGQLRCFLHLPKHHDCGCGK